MNFLSSLFVDTFLIVMVRKAVLLADQCGNEFRGIDLTATHLLKM